MSVKWRKVSHVDAVLKKLDANAESCMAPVGQAVVESVQNQMLYGYHTPHGPDHHTEIVDTGRLFDSIQYEVQPTSQNAYTVNVGSTVEYAAYVHDGTWKLEGRPYIRDGAYNSAEKQKEIYEKHLPNGFR